MEEKRLALQGEGMLALSLLRPHYFFFTISLIILELSQNSSIPFNPLFHFSISLCYSLVSILLILCCMAVKEDGSCYSKSSYFVLSPSKVKRVQRGNLILSVFLSAFPPHRLSHWPHSYNIQVCVKVSSPQDTLCLPVFPSVFFARSAGRWKL